VTIDYSDVTSPYVYKRRSAKLPKWTALRIFGPIPFRVQYLFMSSSVVNVCLATLLVHIPVYSRLTHNW